MGFNPDSGTSPGEAGGSYSGGGTDIIGAVVSAATAIYNADRQKAAQKRQNEANATAAELAYQREQEMWNLQNQYNSPQAQIERLRAGGLNPALMYGGGSGSSASGQANQYPKYQPPTAIAEFSPAPQLGSYISQYQDFKMRQAQIDNVKANTQATNARTVTEGLRPPILKLDAEGRQWDLDTKNMMRAYQATIGNEQAEQSRIRTSQEWKKLSLMGQQEQGNLLQQTYQRNAIGMQEQQKEKLQAEILFRQYQNQWMKEGVTSSDNPMLRILVRQWNELGLPSFSQGINQFRNQNRRK